jgi:hypothetical protein
MEEVDEALRQRRFCTSARLKILAGLTEEDPRFASSFVASYASDFGALRIVNLGHCTMILRCLCDI